MHLDWRKGLSGMKISMDYPPVTFAAFVEGPEIWVISKINFSLIHYS